MVYHSLQELIEQMRSCKTVKRLALAAAEDIHSLTAVLRAASEGLITPILLGDEGKVRSASEAAAVDITGIKIINAPGDEAAARAVALIRANEADFLMKGNVQTGTFLRAVVNKESGLLRSGGILSHLLLVELPAYHKLLGITDSAIVAQPDLDKKRAILENAVGAMRSIGCDTPKVAVLAAVEQINPKMQETVDAAALKKLWQMGEIQNCIVEGPISVDLAFDPESATIKGFDSPVVGDPDILLMPSVVAGNIAVKLLRAFAGSTPAGIAIGAEAPIVLTSRGTSVTGKYLSIALGAAMAALRA